MSADIVVFLGPTLSREAAAGILEADYRPPAEQGSFVRALAVRKPRAAVLIDGAFGSVPAVRHKEIHWALAQGVPVFGAASMGALRAAELGTIGMRGHGFVYRWYALTPLADDDEVAVAMTPPELGSEPLSEALINIRLTLRAAARDRIIAATERRALEDLARATDFVDRSYPRLFDDARRLLPQISHAALRDLEGWLAGNAVDRKREDAVGLLTKLAQVPKLCEERPKVPPFRSTEVWAYDLDAAGLIAEEIASVSIPAVER